MDGNKGGGSRCGMKLVMDFAYDIRGTTLFGKVVRMDNFASTVAIMQARLPCWHLHISDEMVTLTRLGRINFEHCASSAAAKIGRPGQGYPVADSCLARERVDRCFVCINKLKV
jgi:hypothetical protein